MPRFKLGLVMFILVLQVMRVEVIALESGDGVCPLDADESGNTVVLLQQDMGVF